MKTQAYNIKKIITGIRSDGLEDDYLDHRQHWLIDGQRYDLWMKLSEFRITTS